MHQNGITEERHVSRQVLGLQTRNLWVKRPPPPPKQTVKRIVTFLLLAPRNTFRQTVHRLVCAPVLHVLHAVTRVQPDEGRDGRFTFTAWFTRTSVIPFGEVSLYL